MKIFICLSLIVLFGLVNCEFGQLFQIRIKLKDQKFEPVNGALKLIVNNQVLNLNETTLKPNERYISKHRLHTRYEDLGENTDVQFYWTTPYKLNHLFKKPTIHLEAVYLVLMNVRCACVRFYCPVEGQEIIKPNQNIKLKYCGLNKFSLYD